MNNQLALVGQSLSDLMEMAKMFAESGMFTDTKSAAQAIVKIQAGAELGIPPFAAMTGINIIMGKPTIGAGLMAAKVKGSGKYDYRVIQQDDKACSIDFYQGASKIGNSTFTIADAQKANTKNMDKFPKNMLFARAMSNGVRWYTPDVFAGPVYTPEEFIDIPHTVIEPEPTKKQKLTPKTFGEAVKRIESGDNIISKIKETYDLTTEQISKLIELENAILNSTENVPAEPGENPA